MKIFLHIGSHKTGTTAIQSVAARNPGVLRQQGLLYPNYDLIGGTREQSHLRTVERLIKAPDAASANQPAALFAEASRIAEAEGLNMLLSAESLFRLPQGRVADVTCALRDAFPAASFVVVCALRPRADFVESMYRNGYRVYKTVPLGFADWLQKSHALFNYANIVESYTAALQAECIFLPYSQETRANFVSRFFRALNVTLSSELVPGNKNPSLAPVECLAKRIVMADVCDSEMSKQFNTFAARNPVPDTGAYGFLDRQAEFDLRSRFHDSDARMVFSHPELESVLGSSVPMRDAMPLDDRADALARTMAADFVAFRQARNQKARKVAERTT